MSRPASLLLGVLFAAAGLVCWVRAMGASGALAHAPRVLSARLETASLTPAAMEPLEEAAEPYALAREYTATAQAPLFSRDRELTVLEAIGDPALLFPVSCLAAGAFPPAGVDGCVIDAATARAFWGAEEALGQTISLDDGEYTVSGVIESPRPVLVVHRKGAEPFAPTTARRLSSSAFPRQRLDAFLAGLGLRAEQVSDLSRAAAWLRAAALAPAWLACMAACLRLLRAIIPRPRLLRWGCLAGAGYLLGKALGFPALLTPDMLPTRWSDFSFWGDHLRRAADSVFARWAAPGALPEYLLLHGAVLPSLAWSACALILLFPAARCLRAAFYTNIRLKSR